MKEEQIKESTDISKEEIQDTSRRDMLKGAAIAAAGMMSSPMVNASEYDAFNNFKANVKRDNFPFAQSKRKLLANVAYWFEFPSEDKTELEVWSYTDKLTYGPGDTVSLHVNTTAKDYSVEIFRDGGTWESVYKKEGIAGAYQDTPLDAYKNGCNWAVSHQFKIPKDWRSGGYVVVLKVQRGEEVIEHEAFFTLRAAQPGKNSDILFVLSTPTWMAYNDFGGGSSYRLPPWAGGGGRESRDTSFATEYHMHRPWPRGFVRQPIGAPKWARKARTYEDAPIGWVPHSPAIEYYLANGLSLMNFLSGWASYDAHFARWAEQSGYNMEYSEQHDILENPDLLKNYKLVVIVGHDEYVTPQFRNALDAHLERGGRIARFAGNMNWQVRLEKGKQICYKHKHTQDPVWNIPEKRHLVSTWWHQVDGANNPPVTTWGVNGHKGVYAMFGGCTPRASGGFTVYRNKHWAFEGADLYYGDILGGHVPVIGPEVDGIEYTFRYGLPYPTGEDGAPVDDLEILALAPAVAGEEVDHGHPADAYLIGDGKPDAIQYVETLGLEMTEENIDKFMRGCAVITNMKKGKGEVFCAGTLDWVRGLEQKDPFIEKITKNVLDKYIS